MITSAVLLHCDGWIMEQEMRVLGLKMKCKTEPSFAQFSCILFWIRYESSSPLSLSLSSPKQTSQALIAGLLPHRPGGCHVSSLSLRCCQPLPFHCALDLVVAWAGNRKALSDVSSTLGGLVSEQLLRLRLVIVGVT